MPKHENMYILLVPGIFPNWEFAVKGLNANTLGSCEYQARYVHRGIDQNCFQLVTGFFS